MGGKPSRWCDHPHQDRTYAQDRMTKLKQHCPPWSLTEADRSEIEGVSGHKIKHKPITADSGRSLARQRRGMKKYMNSRRRSWERTGLQREMGEMGEL